MNHAFTVLKNGMVCDGSVADSVQFSQGIEQVWVNGCLSFIGQDKSVAARAGRFVSRDMEAESCSKDGASYA